MQDADPSAGLVRLAAGSSGSPPPLERLERPVRALVFDAGDVLYDATVWRRWLLRLLSRLGLHTNYRAFFYLWDHDYLNDVHCGRRAFSEAFRAFLLDAGLTAAQIDEVVAASQAKRDQWEATSRPLPGVRSTLASLRAAGIALGVLSDCEHPAAKLSERLDRFGLEGLFASVISSFDLQQTKPAAPCYQAALDSLQVTSEEAAFVGHDAQELAGATRAGLQTVAFNYDSDSVADVFIARFEDLLHVIHGGGLRAVG